MPERQHTTPLASWVLHTAADRISTRLVIPSKIARLR